MFMKSLVASVFVASVIASGAVVAPAEAAMRHHTALPYRHGQISVSGLRGHRPAHSHNRRHHMHHPMHPMRHHTMHHHMKHKMMKH